MIAAEEERHRAREEAVEAPTLRSSLEHCYLPPPQDPSSSRWMEAFLDILEPTLV